MTSTAGIYWGKLVRWELSVSTNNKPYIYTAWDVTQRANGAKWIELDEPIKCSIYFYLSDAAWPYTKGKLDRLGFNGNFEKEKMDFSDSVKRTGYELEAKDDNFGSEPRLSWDLPWEDSGDTVRDEVPDDLAIKLGAKWKAENPPKPAGRPKTPAKSTAPAGSKLGDPGEISEEEIPF